MGQDTQIAVFIDYDNIEISVEEAFGKSADVDWSRIFGYAAGLGRVIMRRAYADWAEAASKQKQLLGMGVELIHVNSKRGKNAADIRIVLDVLELLYNEKDAFTHILLVSGDGDFTELVHRLRAHGKIVIGMGISGTSADFLVSACDKFVYYDKWQGVNKFKKQGQSNSGQAQQAHQQAQKQNNTPQPQKQEKQEKQVQEQPARSNTPKPIPPEKRLERYLNILAAHKIRMTPNVQRPLVIYKIFDMVKAAPDLTFNQLKEQAQAFFSNVTPKVEPQLALDALHQLFHTFCFEFDPNSNERIMDRKLFLPEETQTPADLLNKCDQKMLQLIIGDLGASEALDKEIAAKILYGSVRNPKVFDHIQDLIDAESQV